MKAVAYLRVSTQEQDLSRQYSDIKSFAKSKGLKIDKIFEDKISGSKKSIDERVGYAEMEEHLNVNPSIKNILVLEISRLGRRNLEIQIIIDDFAKRGINIHFKDLGVSTLKENGEHSFESKLILNMLGVMAENESRLLSERIKSGKYEAAKQGKSFSDKIVGYKKGKDGKPIIDESKLDEVKRIFELSAQGNGQFIIAKIINQEFGTKYAQGTINGMVKNTFYKGERKYKDLELKVPAIVSNELWEKANDLLNIRKKFTSKKIVNTNLLQGIIKCEKCDIIMYQIVAKKGRSDMFKCKSCGQTISRPWLYEVLRFCVESYAQKSREKSIKKEIRQKINTNKSLIESNEKQVKKYNKRKDRIKDLYLDDELTKIEYKEDLSKANNLIDDLKQSNLKLNGENKSLRNSLGNKLGSFSDDLKTFKIQIQDLIDSVIINNKLAIIKIGKLKTYLAVQPEPTVLGWRKRKGEKLFTHNPKEITDLEQLEMMIDNYKNEFENSK